MTTIRKSPSTGEGSPDVWGLYEPDTGSIQYVVACPATRKAAIVDPVWNFEPASARTDTRSANEISDLVAREGLDVTWVLDTHPHADHFTAGAILAERFRVPHAIGERTKDVAALWRGFYHEPDAFDVDTWPTTSSSPTGKRFPSAISRSG